MCASSACRTEIDRLQREITALGAVNLAALDELARRTPNARPSWIRKTPT